MADLHPDVIRAIRRLGNTSLGRRYDRFARRRYGVRGNVLAAKTISGESGGRLDAVSSAGARGPAQFMPATRAEMIRKHGIDPWRSQAEAVKAMEIYQMEGGRGVEGYNPGDPGYKAYILKQQLDRADLQDLRHGAGGGDGGGTLRLQGRRTTDVGLQSYTIPGQSFQAERDAARDQLFLSGKPLSVESLLAYKSTVNSLKDVPEQKVLGDLVVRQHQGKDVRVPMQGASAGGRRGSVARGGKIIGTPYKGTHTLGNWQSDNAIDISMPLGSPIFAPRDAVVLKVGGGYSGGQSRFDGYQVTVRTADGNELFYTHLSKAFVKPGQRLRAGQRVGRSGAANGVPHLHLGAMKGKPQHYFR